jgi:hypothetical protein
MPAKPNYEFLKRQKEQAKQKKKEEKRQRKLLDAGTEGGDGASDESLGQEDAHAEQPE